LVPQHGRGQHQAKLLGEHPGDRQREPVLGRQARAEPTGAVEREQGQGQRAQPAAAGRSRQRGQNRVQRPAQQRGQQGQQGQQGQNPQRQLPAGNAVGEHGRHAGNVLAVPIQIDGPPHQGRHGDIHVSPQDKREADADQRVSQRAALHAPPCGGQGENQQQRGQLDRQIGNPSHADRRPAVLEGQRRVEQEQRQQRLEHRRRPAVTGRVEHRAQIAFRSDQLERHSSLEKRVIGR